MVYKDKKFRVKTLPFKSFIELCTRWLGRGVLKLSRQDLNLALRVLEKIIRIYDTRGKAECIKYVKGIRLTFQKAVFNIAPDWSLENRIIVPKVLKPIYSRIILTQGYALIRLTLSVLFSTRALRSQITEDFNPIEDGPTFKYVNAIHLKEDIISFLKTNGVNLNQLGKRPQRLNFSEFQMTSKSGPNGHALWTSFLDYRGLTSSQKESLTILAGDKLMDLASRFDILVSKFPKFFYEVGSLRQETTHTRKLIWIQDKECKSRGVAVLDYWSQSALFPLHKYLERFLKRIPQDCTHNQTKNFKWIRTKDNNHYWSIDLSSATDRFPHMVIRQLLSIWFGESYANAWLNIMIGEPFICKDRKVSYSVGTPMGAYTSFNAFAVAHHFFIFLACKRANKNWKRCPYMLLGDDIVIADDKVAEEYMMILEEWGVNVSLQKTHKSKNGFEFAKQTRLHRENVSQFPFSALFDRRSETFTTAGIIATEVWVKEWKVDLDSSLKSYFVEVLRWPRPRFRAFAPTLYLSIDILGFLQGRRSLGKGVIRYVSSKTGIKFEMNSWDLDLYSKVLLLHLLHRTFMNTKEVVISANNKKPLGLLAEQMVLLISLLEDDGALLWPHIEAVPFLQIYGRAEETWLNLRTDLSVYQIGESEKKFRNMFQKIDIPGSDCDFHTRHRDIVMIKAATAAKQLGEMIFSYAHVEDPRIDLDITVPWKSHIYKDVSDNLDFPVV